MATNERLRDAMLRAGLDPEALGELVPADPKTVERWISGRTPHPKSRYKVAAALKEDVSYLWPEATDDAKQPELSASELVRIYHRRSQIEVETWERLLNQAEQHLDVLVLAGLFLPEQQSNLAETLCAKARAGTQVRILLGDPDGEQVSRRGAEEGIGDVIQAKVRNVLSFFESHADCFEIRLHDTTLYNSIYRFDADMLVNTHIHGLPAAQAPVLWLRQLAGGQLYKTYAESFDRIWHGAVDARAK